MSLSAATYTAALNVLERSSLGSGNPIADSKALSDVHSLFTTVGGLYALSKPWSRASHGATSPATYLDDRRNPLIWGRSSLGNAITSWETGYLLFDTIHKLLLQYRGTSAQDGGVPRRLANAFVAVSKKEPVIWFHHLALLGALSGLQVYTARGRERGVWIIVAMMLMNASTPVMHWRWRQIKRNGKSSLKLDVVFALVFAACRFGVVFYVVRKYAKYHGLESWEAFRRQRAICQLSTASLVVLNGVWWSLLLKRIFGRIAARISAQSKTR